MVWPSIAANAASAQKPCPASGSGSASRANQPTPLVSSGWPCSSPPTARQWNSTMYIAKRVKPRRWPSVIDSRPIGSHSIPVSSATSFTATSAGE